ncbi:hypothetical protein AB0K71_17990 [Streptomyces syringium]|uniref:hypothetical protein n=1 Tax=Streptomyces syringium TaxID=76729 RepID=UPI0034398853
MPAALTLTSHRPSTGEVVDAETLALLDELDVPLPADFAVDLDIDFGTPLEMYEPAGTARPPSRARPRARPAITALVRERLVDVLPPGPDDPLRLPPRVRRGLTRTQRRTTTAPAAPLQQGAAGAVAARTAVR